MEVGLFFTFRNPPPWRRDPAQLYADTLAQVRLADDAGFDAVWMGEHHFTDDGFAPALMPLAAAIAVATSRVQIGTDVLLLPQHHPVRLAEAATTVDLLSNGRLVLGLGLGYRPSEFAAVGLDYHRRGDLMDEALEVLVGCFTREAFSFDGRYYAVREVTLSPRPVQRPMPRIALGGTGPRMLERAARFGCSGLMSTPTADVLARHLQLVQQHGGDVTAQRYYGMAMGFVAETEDAAWAVAHEHAAWELEHYNDWFASAGLPRIFPNGPRADFVIGPPAQWLDRVDHQLHGPAPVRCDHLVVELTISGMAHGHVMRAIELFADQVLPGLHAM
jgi:alkanesulfonate monooxygenase SsuD/methylene tetrahydromethanopterin reductase-like flavin-dependent oxidoreductase (luciferase family)